MNKKEILHVEDDFEGNINKKYWNLKRIEPELWSISSKHCHSGKKSLKITVITGAKKEVGNDGIDTERSEFSEDYSICPNHNEDVSYEFAVFFPNDFAIIDNRLVFAQWKQITEKPFSPALSFRYRNGELCFDINRESQERKSFYKTIDLRGKWHVFKTRFKIGKNNDGYCKVFMDGKSFMDYKGEIGYKFKVDLIYFKFGLYRDKVDTPQSVYFDSFKKFKFQKSKSKTQNSKTKKTQTT